LKNHKQIETQETTHVAGSPLLVEKRIKHSFEDGVYSGRVVSVVPGFPKWFNVKYDNDPALISSFQKLSPVKVNKLFHCVKSCCRRDLIFIQCINFEELKIHKLTVVLWLLQARLKEHKFPNFVKLTLILNGGVLSATSGYLEHYDRHTCMQVLSTILVQKSEQVLLFLPQRS
jgi:hypothetical protein